MASNSQFLPNDEYTPHSTPIFQSTTSPNTHLKFKGIPFSWEQIPGIPKHQLGSKKKEYSEHLLPLPPAGNSNSAAKKSINQEEISPKKIKSNRFDHKDPFFAALMECSKDDDHDHDDHHATNYGTIWKSNSKNITRSLSDRFGFINLYTSCKRTCAVSESIVYLRPRSSPHYLLNRRSS